MKNRIILNASEAQRLARGALAAASPDDVTPVITGALLSVTTDGKVTLVATDRYRVHRMFTDAMPMSAENTTDDGIAVWDEDEVLLPPAALKWISANALKFKFYASVVIEWDPYVAPTRNPATLGELGRIRIEVRSGMGGALLPEEDGYLAWGGRPIAGTFPPVARLFEKLEWGDDTPDKGVLLNVDYMAKLKALSIRKGSTARIRTTKPSASGKPGPVVFGFEDRETRQLYADALIAPNLDLR